jgi:hypothetical protein
MTNPAINEILASFDFEKVHRVMVFLRWEWVQPYYPAAVPSVERLQSEAARLLALVKDGEKRMSGGFEVERQGDWYSLAFVLTDRDAGGKG